MLNGNAIVGTLVMVATASVISIPIGVLAAVYLSELGPNSRLIVLAAQLQALQTMIGSIEKRLVVQHRANEASKRLESVPGIGLTNFMAAKVT